MPQRFNIGLLPESHSLNDEMIALAQGNCSAQADGYCLDAGSLPHITLCQFTAEEAAAKSVWDAASNMLPEDVPVHFTHLYMRPGTNEHKDYLWCGVAVRDGGLPLLQKQVHQQVLERDLLPHTASAWFSPHVTWARMKSPPLITHWPGRDIWQDTHELRPALGISDANGAWLKTLYRLSLA